MNKIKEVLKRLAFLTIAVIIAFSLFSCTQANQPDKDDSSDLHYGSQLTKLLVQNGMEGSMRIDFNNDGFEDEFVIDAIGSGISVDTLSFVDGKTGERTSLISSWNGFMRLGLAEDNKKTPLIFNYLNALYDEDINSALAEPYAKIVLVDNKPSIQALNETGDYIIKCSLDPNNQSKYGFDDELYVKGSNLEGFFNLEYLKKSDDFFVVIRYYYKENIEVGITIKTNYCTIHGDKAKNLYKAITQSTLKDIAGNISVDIDHYKCDFVLSRHLDNGYNNYYFCGSFDVQKKNGITLMSVVNGSLYSKNVKYEVDSNVFELVKSTIVS